jgi:hypothetical protein
VPAGVQVARVKSYTWMVSKYMLCWRRRGTASEGVVPRERGQVTGARCQRLLQFPRRRGLAGNVKDGVVRACLSSLFTLPIILASYRFHGIRLAYNRSDRSEWVCAQSGPVARPMNKWYLQRHWLRYLRAVIVSALVRAPARCCYTLHLHSRPSKD